VEEEEESQADCDLSAIPTATAAAATATGKPRKKKTIVMEEEEESQADSDLSAIRTAAAAAAAAGSSALSQTPESPPPESPQTLRFLPPETPPLSKVPPPASSLPASALVRVPAAAAASGPEDEKFDAPEVDFGGLCEYLMGTPLSPATITRLRARIADQFRSTLQAGGRLDAQLWQADDFARLLTLYDRYFFSDRLRHELATRRVRVHFAYSRKCTSIAGSCRGQGTTECEYTLTFSQPVSSNLFRHGETSYLNGGLDCDPVHTHHV
jgi:hypothetical protein